MKFQFGMRVRVTRGFYSGMVGHCVMYFEHRTGDPAEYMVALDDTKHVTPEQISPCLPESILEGVGP